MATMTIKELKKIIQDLPDDMPIGSIGHYGELLQCFGASVEPVDIANGKGRGGPVNIVDALSFDIESAGEQPD